MDNYNFILRACSLILPSFLETSWKTRYDKNGNRLYNGDWFVLGMIVNGSPLTFYFRSKDWDSLSCREIDKIPKDWVLVMSEGDSYAKRNNL